MGKDDSPPPHQPVFKRISKPGSNWANDFLEQRAGRDAVHCIPPPPPNRRKNPACALASPGPQFPLDIGMNCFLNSWVRLLSSLCHPRPVSLSTPIQASGSHFFRPCFSDVLCLSSFLGGQRVTERRRWKEPGHRPPPPSAPRAAETAILNPTTRGRQDKCGRGRGSARWFSSV